MFISRSELQKGGRDREEEAKVCLLFHFPKGYSGQGWARLILETGSIIIQVTQVDDGGPKTWAIFCSFLQTVSRELESGAKTRTSTYMQCWYHKQSVALLAMTQYYSHKLHFWFTHLYLVLRITIYLSCVSLLSDKTNT